MICRILMAFCLSVPSGLAAQAARPPVADSVRRLVQGFYDWYVANAATPATRDMIMPAATSGPVPFRSELVRWLRIDSTARAHAQGEVDGLDGDPYLYAQDPCGRYTVRSVRLEGRAWLATVVGSGECPPHTRADVVVELEREGGRWTIVEFRDPHRGNAGLLPLLKTLHPTAR